MQGNPCSRSEHYLPFKNQCNTVIITIIVVQYMLHRPAMQTSQLLTCAPFTTTTSPFGSKVASASQPHDRD
jgi:hypothetical protein